ncbi:MAG: uroporphyrinogen decarboxylase family protein [Victivallales bacterium]
MKVEMNNRERFNSAMNFEKVDRLPAMEWICWWDKTLERWYSEGLPANLDREDILRWFGLDVHEWVWISPRWKIKRPEGRDRSEGVIETEAEYDRLVAPAFSNPEIDRKRLSLIAEKHAKGEVVVQLQFDGFFWFPREIFGVERHLFSFFDQPELMQRMNEDLCRYNISCLEQVLEILTPDMMTIAEDLSYNNGPMLSREQFEQFVTPYYRKIVPAAKERGIIPMVDTDGDVTEVIPWLQSAGIEGCLPLERMAGVDVAELRRRYPDWKMIGGFDKTIMHLGEEAIRREFERLLPVMRSGGYIPTTDHQTPPAVSIDNFRDYVRTLKEYCGKMN